MTTKQKQIEQKVGQPIHGSPPISKPAAPSPANIKPPNLSDNGNPFESELAFRVAAGKWPEDDGGGALRDTFENLVKAHNDIAKAWDVHHANPAATPLERERSNAETAWKLMQAATMRADSVLAANTKRTAEMRQKLDATHLKQSQNAREELLFQDIRRQLRGTDRFALTHQAARNGDGDTVRAVLTAPRWYWRADVENHKQALSDNARGNIRRAYLNAVAPAELALVELNEKAAERVVHAAELLMERVFGAIDFQKVDKDRKREAQAKKLVRAAAVAAAEAEAESKVNKVN